MSHTASPAVGRTAGRPADSTTVTDVRPPEPAPTAEPAVAIIDASVPERGTE